MKTRTLLIILLTAIIVVGSCKRKDAGLDRYRFRPDYLKVSDDERQQYYNAYNQVMELWPVDYTDLYIPVKQGTAHVIVAGADNAQPLVLLHGMNASSAMWYPNIDKLSASYKVFAIDLITEPGKSKPDAEIDDSEALMLWYERILDKLKLEKYSLIGASKGGWLAAKLAIRQPDKVEKLVLLSPAQTFIWTPPDKALITNVLYELAPTRERLEKLFGQMSTHPEQIAPAFLDLFHQASKLSAIDKLLMEMQPLSDNELQRLDMPALVLIGEQDIINNSRSLERARAIMPNVQTEIVKDAGHFLSLDRAEYVNGSILHFLEE
jgi:pimeloyl-ACP methyl ester carboxylesterase